MECIAGYRHEKVVGCCECIHVMCHEVCVTLEELLMELSLVIEDDVDVHRCGMLFNRVDTTSRYDW